MFAASVATSEGKVLAREVKKETNLRLSRFSCQTSSLLASSRRSDIYMLSLTERIYSQLFGYFKEVLLNHQHHRKWESI